MQSKVLIGVSITAAIVVVVAAVLFFWRPAKPVEHLALCCPESVQPLFQELAESYRASHEGAPSIEIEGVADESCTADFLRGQIASGAADIVVLKTAGGGAALDSAGLADLSGSVSVSDDALPFAPLDADGAHSLPLCGEVPVLLCNTALFDQAGLPLPDSRSAFLGSCWTLEAEGIAPFGLEVDEAGRWNAADLLDSCLLNGDYELERALVVEGDLNVGFYDYEYLAENLQQVLPARDEAPHGHDALLQAFADGSYAMVVGTSSEYEALAADGVSCAALPLYGATDGVRMAWSTAYALSVSQRVHGAETKEFLNWLLSAEAQQAIYAALGYVPAGSGVEVGEADQMLYTPSPTSEWCAAPSFVKGFSPSQREACLAACDAAFDGSFDADGLLESLSHG